MTVNQWWAEFAVRCAEVERLELILRSGLNAVEYSEVYKVLRMNKVWADNAFIQARNLALGKAP
jgi:hypothetical protein